MRTAAACSRLMLSLSLLRNSRMTGALCTGGCRDCRDRGFRRIPTQRSPVGPPHVCLDRPIPVEFLNMSFRHSSSLVGFVQRYRKVSERILDCVGSMGRGLQRPMMMDS